MYNKLKQDYYRPSKTISIRISNRLYNELKEQIPCGYDLSSLIRSILIDFIESNT